MNTITLTNDDVLKLFPMFAEFLPLQRPRIVPRASCLWINPLEVKWTPGSITTLMGFSSSSVFLSRRPSEEHKEIESWAMNQPALFLEADMTDELSAEISKRLPTWFDPQIAKRYLDRKSGIGGMKEIASPNDGMYTVRDEVCSNQTYALFYAALNHVPLELVKFQPGYRLLFNNKQSRFTGSPLTIWQRDDEVLFERMECSNDAEIELSKDGSRFLTAAMKVKSQRTPAIIRMFSESQSFALKQLKQKEKGRAGDYQGKSLHEVTLSSSEKVWLVATAWAYLGDDGDSGEYETIYIDYDKALTKYTEEDPK